MSAAIVRHDGPILLVGAGDTPPEDLELADTYGGRVVAADGGAVACVAAGIVPDAVIGDLDSLPAEVRAALDPARVHRVAEQETTDFDKALRLTEAPLAVAVGFAGPRLDHTLAVFNVLVRHPERRVIVAGAADIAFHCPPELDLAPATGSRLSLFPMAPVTGRSEGLRWPIDGLAFAPDGRIGTSNEVTGQVRLRMDGPGMLVIMPRAELASAARALAG